MQITTEQLKKWGACDGGMQLFVKTFPTGAPYVEVQAALRAVKNADYAQWLAGKAFDEWASNPEFVRAEAGVADEMVKEISEEAKSVDSGDSSQLAASGDYSRLAASGHSSQLAASGHYSQLVASGTYSQLAASGHYSRLAASGHSSRLAASGHSSQLAASGDSSQLAASGDYSQLAASGHSSQLAASGDYSQLAASGDYSQLAASGSNSVIAAAGSVKEFTLGEGGCAAIPWHDGTRTRFAIAYVGENIEAGKRYRVNQQGGFDCVADE